MPAKRNNHHCPGETGTVDGFPGNCRKTKANTHCHVHQNYCTEHEFCYMKGKGKCPKCEKAKEIADKQKKDGKDDDDKPAKKAKPVTKKTSGKNPRDITPSTTKSNKKEKKAVSPKQKAGKGKGKVSKTSGGVSVEYTLVDIEGMVKQLSPAQWKKLAKQVNIFHNIAG